ncbi:transcriptional regulator [Lewinellaceae bacterium SD302]|nr:transcriptional regulator [Lewinellaceae bacterium SD302]
MAHAKRYLFETQERVFADGCKALGHPARRRIVALLRARKHMTLEQLKKQIPLAESTVSQHTKKLQAADLIQVKGNENGESGFVLNSLTMGSLREVMISFWKES